MDDSQNPLTEKRTLRQNYPWFVFTKRWKHLHGHAFFRNTAKPPLLVITRGILIFLMAPTPLLPTVSRWRQRPRTSSGLAYGYGCLPADGASLRAEELGAVVVPIPAQYPAPLSERIRHHLLCCTPFMPLFGDSREYGINKDQFNLKYEFLREPDGPIERNRSPAGLKAIDIYG